MLVLSPFLIQWDKTPHPAALMQESGCGLVKLYGYHAQPEVITHILEFFGAEKLIEMKQLESESSPYLTAVIDTPAGLKMLT
jgi:hypothetical protein